MYVDVIKSVGAQRVKTDLFALGVHGWIICGGVENG